MKQLKVILCLGCTVMFAWLAASCGGGSSPASCSDPMVECKGACVDLESDRRYCSGDGTCGTGCASGELYNAGLCEPSCQAGLTECSGLCVDTTYEPANSRYQFEYLGPTR